MQGETRERAQEMRDEALGLHRGEGPLERHIRGGTGNPLRPRNRP